MEEIQRFSSIIEALLFASDDPVSMAALEHVLECDRKTILKAVSCLKEELAELSRGIMLQEVAGGLTLVTKPAVAPYVEKIFQSRSYRLSKASLETLAIIAYRQPITRLEVEEIRGVKCESVLANLMARNLIVEVGRQDTVGRPILYGTSKDFLRHFGLTSLKELPHPEDLRI